MNPSDWPAVADTADQFNASMDAQRLSKLDHVIPTDYENITGVFVVRNNQLAYERYFLGSGPQDPQHVASVTKSVLSALIGIAIAKGFIHSVDQPVLDFFPEFTPDANKPLKRAITLRHLLTMTVPYSFADWREPLDILCMQPDWAAYILETFACGGEPGAFKYATANAHLLSAVITRSTGQNALAFANENLFMLTGMQLIPDEPMQAFGFDELFGAKVRGWVKDPQGNAAGGWGLTLTPRDMARFGQLYMNQGRWGDIQILPEGWVEESWQMNGNAYGFFWWLHQGEDLFCAMALGDGGNAIYCIPQYNLVVAIASQFMPNPRDRWKLVKEVVLPAVRD